MMDEVKDNPNVKTVFRLYEGKTQRLLTDRVTFIFLELNKFHKTPDELDGNVLEGMYFCFKNMPALSERPDILRHDVFRKIFDVTELLNMDNVTRSKVLEKMTTERDLRNQIRYATETAMTKGMEKGLAKGRAKGLEEGRTRKSRGPAIKGY